MKCHYCGTEQADNVVFCRHCGTRRMAAPTLPVEESQVRELGFTPEPESSVMPEPELIWEQPEHGASEPQVEAEEAFYQEVSTWEPQPEISRTYTTMLRLPVRRSLAKMFFLGILTLGIYPTVIWSRIVTELNLAASRHDGQRTMPYFAMAALAPVTLGIYIFVWMHRFCRRIGAELQRRSIDYKFGPATFWLWNVLGSLILVGPFIFVHKLMKSMNRINADYNLNG